MENNSDIGEKLDVLIKLQAGSLVKGMSSKKEKILFLGSAGLSFRNRAFVVKKSIAAKTIPPNLLTAGQGLSLASLL